MKKDRTLRAQPENGIATLPVIYGNLQFIDWKLSHDFVVQNSIKIIIKHYFKLDKIKYKYFDCSRSKECNKHIKQQINSINLDPLRSHFVRNVIATFSRRSKASALSRRKNVVQNLVSKAKEKKKETNKQIHVYTQYQFPIFPRL